MTEEQSRQERLENALDQVEDVLLCWGYDPAIELFGAFCSELKETLKQIPKGYVVVD